MHRYVVFELDRHYMRILAYLMHLKLHADESRAKPNDRQSAARLRIGQSGAHDLGRRRSRAMYGG